MLEEVFPCQVCIITFSTNFCFTSLVVNGLKKLSLPSLGVSDNYETQLAFAKMPLFFKHQFSEGKM